MERLPGRHEAKEGTGLSKWGSVGNSGVDADSEEPGKPQRVLQTVPLHFPMKSSKMREVALKGTSATGATTKHKLRGARDWSLCLYNWTQFILGPPFHWIVKTKFRSIQGYISLFLFSSFSGMNLNSRGLQNVRFWGVQGEDEQRSLSAFISTNIWCSPTSGLPRSFLHHLPSTSLLQVCLSLVYVHALCGTQVSPCCHGKLTNSCSSI